MASHLQRQLEMILEENLLMAGFKERDIKKIETDCQQEKELHEKALVTVKPFRDEVVTALNNIGRSDVHEIGSFTKAPKPVIVLCHCLASLLGRVEDDWNAIHSHIRDPNFLRHLKQLDIDSITNKQSSKAKGLLKNITEDEMMKVCQSGVGLLRYIQAVLHYCDTAKQTHLHQKKEKFVKADDILDHKRKELEKMYKERESLETALQNLKQEVEINTNNNEEDETVRIHKT